MSDREVRSRRKRKAALERGVAEVAAVEKRTSQKHSDSDPEEYTSSAEPSTTARVTFLIIFIALAVTAGAVYLALQSTAYTETAFEEAAAEVEESVAFLHNEEVGSEHLATEAEDTTELESDSKISNGNGDRVGFNTDSTEELQSSEYIHLETTSADTPHYFDASSTSNIAEMPVQVSQATEPPTLEHQTPSATESFTAAESSTIKQDEAAQAVSLEATAASDSSVPMSEMSTSTSESMHVEPVMSNEEPAITNEYDERIQEDLRQSEELLEKEMDDIFWDL